MRVPSALIGVCLACNSSGTKTAPLEPGAPSKQRAPKSGEIYADPDGTAPPHPASRLNPGEPAPNVELQLQNGKSMRVEDLRGQHVVLFFYPMDDTPGCRAEAHGFRDRFRDFTARNSMVLGVSLQGAESHKAFIEKEKLPFDLVVDSKAEVSNAFGVPIHGQVTARQTFLLDESGVVSHVWRRVSPSTHAEEVLAAIE